MQTREKELVGFERYDARYFWSRLDPLRYAATNQFHSQGNMTFPHWSDMLILSLALVLAPYLRRFMEGQPIFPASQQPRSPGSEAEMRQVFERIARESGHYGAPEDLSSFQDYYNKVMAPALEHERRRKAYAASLPPSFPPDSARFSSGPVQIRWDYQPSLDDFWKNDYMPGREIYEIVDPSSHSFEVLQDDVGNPRIHRKVLAQFRRTLPAVENLHWKKEPVRQGRCHEQLDGTICAVHRWNGYATARDIGNQQEQTTLADSLTLQARLQCWNDPGLRQMDPSFLQRHDEFKDGIREMVTSLGSGDVCILDLGTEVNSIVVAGCPMFHARVCMNDFDYVSSHGECEWSIQISKETTPLMIVQEMQELVMSTICGAGGCVEEAEQEVDAHKEV